MTEPARAEAADGFRLQQVRSHLLRIFAELFRLAPEELPSDANFFELGADSLLLLRASQQIEESFRARIPFRRLVEELATVDAEDLKSRVRDLGRFL